MKKKQILIVSHCILNTASKVSMNEKDLAEEYRVKAIMIQSILEQGIQLIQLPCPEFFLYGSRRWGHTKDQFSHPHFKNESRHLIAPILDAIEEYQTYPKEFEILGIVSVEGSPSCGYHTTCRGKWGGELGRYSRGQLLKKVSSANESGAFMAVVEEELKKRNLSVPILTMEQTIDLLKQRREKL